MAKILDSSRIGSNIQKVVETAAGYIINGHYYDKTSLVPRPLKFFQTNGDFADLAMSKRISRFSAASWQKTYGDTIVVDRYDPTITYVCTTQLRSNAICWVKLKENNGNPEQISSVQWGAGAPFSYPSIRQVVGQDQYYIYVLLEGNVYGSQVGRIDKSTLAWTVSINLGSYASSMGFKENETYIYIASKRQFGASSIQRINKVTAAVETIPVVAKSGTPFTFTTGYSDPIVVAENEIYLYEISYNTSTAKYYFTRNKIDTTQSTLASIVTESAVNVTWGGGVTQLPVLATNYSAKYELFVTLASNGKKYLNVAVMENMNSSTPASIAGSGIYTFLIDPDTKDLTFKNFYSVTNSYFRQFLGLRDNTSLVAMSDDATIFLSFNEGTEKFGQTDMISNQPSHIGIDQLDNIWIVNSLTEVEMLSPYIPTAVNIQFEKSNYRYEGVDYDSFITIEAKNFNGQNIASSLEIALKGNVVFKSNGGKIITETTLTTGARIIPITVKGAGNLNAFPKLVL